MLQTLDGCELIAAVILKSAPSSSAGPTCLSSPETPQRGTNFRVPERLTAGDSQLGLQGYLAREDDPAGNKRGKISWGGLSGLSSRVPLFVQHRFSRLLGREQNETAGGTK